jgi:hypothetical protein
LELQCIISRVGLECKERRKRGNMHCVLIF